MVGLSDLTNKNTGHLIKFDINKEYHTGILILKNYLLFS